MKLLSAITSGRNYRSRRIDEKAKPGTASFHFDILWLLISTLNNRRDQYEPIGGIPNGGIGGIPIPPIGGGGAKPIPPPPIPGIGGAGKARGSNCAYIFCNK